MDPKSQKLIWNRKGTAPYTTGKGRHVRVVRRLGTHVFIVRTHWNVAQALWENEDTKPRRMTLSRFEERYEVAQ